jgi:parallel beta-helix repeat protein
MRRHDTRGVPGFTRLAMAAIAAALPFLGVADIHATVDLCGATITEDVVLDQDLTCAAGGIIVGADGIKLNLQGHSITGSLTGTGILITGRTGVTVFGGGTIANFQTGVLATASTDVVIKDTTFVNNADGVDLQAGTSVVTIKANTFLNQRTRGIMLRGGTSELDVKDNTLTGNRVGILLFGPTATVVKDNSISASPLAGVRINFLATGNLVLNNNIASNPAGIDYLPAPDGSGAVGNAINDNTIASNTCGIRGPSGGSSYKDNQFIGNTTDICG